MADLTLAELQTMRDALIRARMGGLRSVRDQNGEEITYKSDAEMAAALRNIESMISFASTGCVPNVIRFNTSKGT